MPAYFSIEVSFKKNILNKTFVKDIYNTLDKSGFRFKSGYWFGEDMSLEQIIDWNQKLLEKKFELDFKQHVKFDYKQILLDTSSYSHMRAFWMYLNKRINLSIIIPEYDVLSDENSIMFLTNKISPIIDLSCNIWDTGMVSSIQSCLELDAGVDYERLDKGELPTINPFCIIEKDIYQDINPAKKDKFTVSEINNNGVLLVDNCKIDKLHS